MPRHVINRSSGRLLRTALEACRISSEVKGSSGCRVGSVEEEDDDDDVEKLVF